MLEIASRASAGLLTINHAPTATIASVHRHRRRRHRHRLLVACRSCRLCF